jgi:transcriptional regulator with XRE-family HTH domain
MMCDVVHYMADGTTAPPLTLKQLRENAGLTQLALGKLAGLTQSCISQIENGDRRGYAPALKRIADVLGVTVTDIRTAQEDIYEQARAVAGAA